TSVTVPGVATLLTNLMFGTASPDGSGGLNARPFGSSTSTPEKQQALSPVVGGSYPNPQVNVNVASASPVEASRVNKSNTINTAPSNNASIQCDTRLNAIVIRDSEDRMVLYSQTIAQLDRPVSLIEINAAIVDIDSAYLQDLGNQYFKISKNQKSAAVNLVGPLSAVGSLANNFAFQGLVNGAVFMSSVEALANDSHAQVLSRPSVLTLDNTQAIINRQQQFYVPVTSTYDASLFNVTPGMTLQVTPHLIVEPNTRKIKLLVNIQDGAIDNSVPQVSSIPVVSQSNITTQGIVDENLSLLIGGYYQKQNSKGTVGLPFLSQIPIIGLLFGTESRQHTITNRMYLITPKVVESTPENSEQFNRYFEPAGIQRNVDLRPEPDGYLVPLPIAGTMPGAPAPANNRKSSLADNDVSSQRSPAVGPPR
ncbi:MAG: EscC/YscC/HrcC family type III secretion system outer membrane ring protein, partial [Verrucomicrobia bacterium 21-51-4]